MSWRFQILVERTGRSVCDHACMGQDWIELLLEAKKVRESEASQRAQSELEGVARVRAAGPDLAKLLLTTIQNAVA
jgi:hypothetical protein